MVVPSFRCRRVSGLVLYRAVGIFMVLMAPSLEHASNTEQRADLFDRCLRAAEVFWQVENLEVIMPVFESAEAQELCGILQSIGLTVFNGTNGVGCDDLEGSGYHQSKVVMFHASDWRTPAARKGSDAVREVFPEAIICVVTGVLPLPDSTFYTRQPVFDDARALLQSAGIGFFSFEGAGNELSA
jgi:hypothetical protein